MATTAGEKQNLAERKIKNMIKFRLMVSTEQRIYKIIQLKELRTPGQSKAIEESCKEITQRMDDLCGPRDLKVGVQEILIKQTKQTLKDVEHLVEYRLKKMTEKEVDNLTYEKLRDLSEDINILTEERFKLMRDNCFHTLDEQLLILNSKVPYRELIEVGRDDVVDECLKQLNEKKLKVMSEDRITMNEDEFQYEQILAEMNEDLDKLAEQRINKKTVKDILPSKKEKKEGSVKELTGKDERTRMERIHRVTENGLKFAELAQQGKENLVETINLRNMVKLVLVG